MLSHWLRTFSTGKTGRPGQKLAITALFKTDFKFYAQYFMLKYRQMRQYLPEPPSPLTLLCDGCADIQVGRFVLDILGQGEDVL